MTDLQQEVWNEVVGLQITDVVLLVGQEGEEPLYVVQGLVQHAGVGVVEPQGQPLQEKVKVVEGLLLLGLDALKENSNNSKLNAKPAHTNEHMEKRRGIINNTWR